jgi:hypothetical protein
MKLRKPHGGLPVALAANGYVTDLEFELTKVAEGFGLSVYAFKKNRRYWLAVPLPTEEELPSLDLEPEEPAHSEEAA